MARLNLPTCAYAPEQRVEVYAAAVRGLITLEEDGEKQSKYIDFIDIYAGLDDNEVKRYQREYPMKTIDGWICQKNAQFPTIFTIL